jgi:hypothetical protein
MHNDRISEIGYSAHVLALVMLIVALGQVGA